MSASRTISGTTTGALRWRLLAGLAPMLWIACSETGPTSLPPATTVASVTVSPSAANVPLGETLQLTALLRDSTGAALSGRGVTWLSSHPGRAVVNPAGQVRGIAAGPAVIVAMSEGRAGYATLTIGAAQSVGSVELTPATPVLAPGQTLQLSATVKDENGNVVSRPVSFESSNPAVANVDNSGVVAGYAAGEATITAAAEGRTASASVRIDRPVASVGINVTSFSLTVGGSYRLVATAYDTRGYIVRAQSITWSSSNPAVATVRENGTVTGVGAGSAMITASCQGKSTSVPVTVSNSVLPVASVSVTPSSGNLQIGSTLQLLATAKDLNGSPVGGVSFAWNSSNPAVATVSPSGLVTAVAMGSASVSATAAGKTASAALTIASESSVASITLSPNFSNLAVGGTVLLVPTTEDAAGNILTGRTITWSSSNPAIASVDPSGLVHGVAPGDATITATSQGKSTTALISVAALPVATVGLNVTSVALIVGGTYQLVATTYDVTGHIVSGSTVVWSSSNSTVAAVSSTGRVTGLAAGSATITATSSGKSATTTVTVTALQPVVANIVVSSPSSSIIVGNTIQLTAVARDQNGNAVAGTSFTWSTSNSAVATVSTSGLVTGASPGSSTITATAGGKAGSAAITVASSVNRLVVSPNPVTLNSLGAQTALLATAYDANNQVVAVPGITWNSMSPAIASVDNAGRVTARAIGTALITATALCCSRADTTLVEVQQAVASLTVSPHTTSVGVGGSVSLSATARDAINNVISGAPIAWATTNSSVATVVQGVVIGVSPGTVTVRASSGAYADSAIVTVTSSSTQPPASVTVTPTNPIITVGNTLQLSAVVKDGLGNILSGQLVIWTSSNGTVAPVTPTGILTAVQTGTVTVTASAGGKTGTTQVSIQPPPQSGGSHEPAGLTTIVDTRGNDKYFGYSLANPGPWYFGGNWGDNNRIAIVPDPAAPYGTALEKRFFAGDDSGWNGVATVRWPAVSQVYFRMVFKLSPNWQSHPGGQKIWYWGAQGTGNYYIMVHSGQLRFHAQFSSSQGAGPDVAVYVGDPSITVSLGAYHTVEVVHKAQSNAGVADGEVHVWFDGKYVNWSRLPNGYPNGGPLVGMNFQSSLSTKFIGMQHALYWGGGGTTKTVNDWFREGALLIKGK